jgi:putative endonuclease
VECRDGSFYTGIATDVERRFREHGDSQRGAKYLRGKGPLKLVFQQEVGDRSLATRIESRIKKLPRSEKSNLGKLPLLIDAFVSEMQPAVSED